MMTALRRMTGTEGGFALVSAMVFVVILLMVGASLVQNSTQELQLASRVRKESRAMNLAEAGVDYAAWRLYNAPTTALPSTWTRGDLATGTFQVTAAQYYDAGVAVPDTVVLRSVGASQGWQSEVKVVGRFLRSPGTLNPVFDHALFSDAELRVWGTANVTGDVHANANVRVGGSARVTGTVSATGTITRTGGGTITGATEPLSSQIPMPTIDLQYYRSIATTVYNGNYNFTGNTTLNGVVFVNGDATINATFSGKGVIVTTGRVTINGSARLQNLATDEFAIVSAGSVRINGTCRIEGFIYTHNLQVPGVFDGNGTADILGGVAADVINVNGTLMVEYRKPTVQLPADSSAPAQFAAISWRRVR